MKSLLKFNNDNKTELLSMSKEFDSRISLGKTLLLYRDLIPKAIIKIFKSLNL
jgi:hypothetical protein